MRSAALPSIASGVARLKPSPLTEIRERHGLTVPQMARIAHVSTLRLHRLEASTRVLPASMLDHFARAIAEGGRDE